MSISTLEKPCEHVALADWHGRLWELRQTAATRHGDAYALRNEAQQLRNETDIKTRWDAYHNNARLTDRVVEVTRWRNILDGCLAKIKDEIKKLSEEKLITDKALENTVNTPLKIVASCIRIRDGRHGNDLNQDEAYVELKNELAVVEAIKYMLTVKVQTAWEQLNRLYEEEYKIELDLDNKNNSLEVDRQLLEMDETSAATSFKPNPLRVPSNCIPYGGWLEYSRYNKLKADNEITASMKLREAMYCSRERAFNDMRAQHDATNQALRRRVYETRRIKTELEWQRLKMVTEMEKLDREIKELEMSLRNKTDRIKLAETRLETRLLRPGAELVHDEAQIGIQDQVLQLRQTCSDINRKIAEAKGTYNALENHLIRIADDLSNKEDALRVDLGCCETRLQLAGEERASPKTQTDVNLKLTRMEDSIPKS